MEGVVLFIIVAALAAFNLAALQWGVDSRIDAVNPRASLSTGITVR